MASVVKLDPFVPVLLSSESLAVSDEQKDYIRRILNKSCSDSRFAQKAYDTIMLVLIAGSIAPPEVTSLSPASVVLGEPSFDIHIMGKNFLPGSIIVFNGFEEPTTRVSVTELTTGVNMPLWHAPATVPISVMTPNGVMSNSLMFEFTSPATRASVARKTESAKTEPTKPINQPPTHVEKK